MGTITWPSATSGTSTPAPPHATNERHPRAINSSRNPAASGAPTPGMHHGEPTSARASPRRSGCGRSHCDVVDDPAIELLDHGGDHVLEEAQDGVWARHRSRSITSPGSITAVGEGSNSRIGGRSCGVLMRRRLVAKRGGHPRSRGRSPPRRSLAPVRPGRPLRAPPRPPAPGRSRTMHGTNPRARRVGP